MKQYYLAHLEDNVYQVRQYDPDMDEYSDTVFQGSLADCEAWIRLQDMGNVEF